MKLMYTKEEKSAPKTLADYYRWSKSLRGIQMEASSCTTNLKDFASQCLTAAQKVKANSLVILEQSCFIGCIAQYAVPIFEDVSGLKCGRDFYLALKVDRQIGFLHGNHFYQWLAAERITGEQLEVESLEQLEKQLVQRMRRRNTQNSPNVLVELLYKQGIVRCEDPILIMGTDLQHTYGAVRRQRLEALSRLSELYSNIDIHDPYLEDEADLNAMGLHLTQNFKSRYVAVLHLSDAPIFNFYDETFYQEIGIGKDQIHYVYQAKDHDVQYWSKAL